MDSQKHATLLKPESDHKREDTDGLFCLIDMPIPPGGGAPPHRHDLKETFIIKRGEIEATFGGKKWTVKGVKRCISLQLAALVYECKQSADPIAYLMQVSKSGTIPSVVTDIVS